MLNFHTIFSKLSAERVILALVLSIYLLILGPKIGFYDEIPDPMHIVVYGSPLPYISYAGSSLEYEFDIASLGLNLFFMICTFYLLFGWFKPQGKLLLVARFIGILMALPLAYLFIGCWFSGYYEILHYNSFEYLSILTTRKIREHSELGGLCFSFEIYNYLDPQQNFFCRRY